MHVARPVRRGGTAVEFALVLPVLTTIVLGCIDFGRFGYSYIAVTNAARAGAGYGSTHTYTTSTQAQWTANVQQAVQNEMSSLSGFDATKLSVTVTPIQETSPAWRVQVAVSYPFQTAVQWPGVPSSITMQQTVVMEAIR
jgi:Flp pilus assembly protein TadG